MGKKLGLIVVVLLLAVGFFYAISMTDTSKQAATNNAPEQSKQQLETTKQPIAEKGSSSDSLRSALQGVVQDSIDKDIQDAVQSELEKTVIEKPQK